MYTTQISKDTLLTGISVYERHVLHEEGYTEYDDVIIASEDLTVAQLLNELSFMADRSYFTSLQSRAVRDKGLEVILEYTYNGENYIVNLCYVDNEDSDYIFVKPDSVIVKDSIRYGYNIPKLIYRQRAFNNEGDECTNEEYYEKFVKSYVVESWAKNTHKEKMGKIINTDDLKKYIQNHRVDVSTSTTQTGNKELLVVKNGKWESLLDEIPAAYNIDKVIEEMKSKSIPALDEDEHIIPESNLHEPCEIQMIPLSEAIEIVKRGLSDSLLQESSQFQQEDFEPDR